MNQNNTQLYVLAFIFYFIGDLTTTYIAINNGMPEKGLIQILESHTFTTMIVVKTIFFTVLYFLIVFFEKRNNNYLCGAILGLIIGMGITVTWINALTILEYLK
ncbi:MAG: hypothetical protein K8R25_02910 [Methanosarcinales archaeon]|nr:hypothetical protein [Methanosarcinales archaeon]